MLPRGSYTIGTLRDSPANLLINTNSTRNCNSAACLALDKFADRFAMQFLTHHNWHLATSVDDLTLMPWYSNENDTKISRIKFGKKSLTNEVTSFVVFGGADGETKLIESYEDSEDESTTIKLDVWDQIRSIEYQSHKGIRINFSVNRIHQSKKKIDLMINLRKK